MNIFGGMIFFADFFFWGGGVSRKNWTSFRCFFYVF